MIKINRYYRWYYEPNYLEIFNPYKNKIEFIRYKDIDKLIKYLESELDVKVKNHKLIKCLMKEGFLYEDE